MQGIAAVSQLLEGARGSVLIAIVFFVSSAVNLCLSFKYGVRKSSRYDKLLFTLALISIIIWYLTKSNATAIWLTALIDVFATTMIILNYTPIPTVRRHTRGSSLQRHMYLRASRYSGSRLVSYLLGLYMGFECRSCADRNPAISQKIDSNNNNYTYDNLTVQQSSR